MITQNRIHRLNKFMKARIRKVINQDRRADFLYLFPQNTVGAEIGVFEGDFTQDILRIAQPEKLHLIDCWWERFGEYFPWKAPDTKFGTLRTTDAFEKVKDVVNRLDKNKASVFHVGDDLIVLKKFENYYFDWVYLDTTHSHDQTKKELEILKDKVKLNGIIAGHDWQEDPKHKHFGVCKAVKEFCERRNWEIYQLDRHTQWCIKRRK